MPVLILALLSISSTCVQAADETVSPDEKAVSRYQARLETVKTDRALDDAMKSRAQLALEATQTNEYKSRVDDNKIRLQIAYPEIFGAPPVESKAKVAAKDKQKDDLIGGDRIFIFISKSVPEETLRNYIIDMQRLPQATAVMRGFVGGAKRMQPTVQFIGDLMKEDRHCKMPDCNMRPTNVIVDPIMFERLGIDRVPAIAYIENYERIGYCSEGLADQARMSNINVIYGDVSLRYALEYLDRKQPSAKLKALIDRFKS